MNKKLLFGLIGLGVLAGLGGGIWFFTSGDKSSLPPPIAPIKVGDLAINDKPESVEIKGTQPSPNKLDNTQIEVNPTEIATIEVMPPEFDVIRVTPDGAIVIAGRADANAEVFIHYNSKEAGKVTANDAGEWVYSPKEKLKAGDYEISLMVLNNEGTPVWSEKVELVSVAGENKKENPLMVETDKKGGGSKVRNAGKGRGENEIAIEAIDYFDEGLEAIGGYAAADSRVLLYLDDKMLGETKATPSGNWNLSFKERLNFSGEHKIRADMVDASGKVVARAEVAFDPERDGGSMPEGRIVMVKAGNSLWKIARRLYGSGFAYTVIYEANKAQIRNPNLIYPGQLFVMPPKVTN